MSRTAIDLYSGIGGWTLGLKMAGIETVASYEWWSTANDTHRLNFPDPTHQIDIRSLDAASVPKVDYIVGSPPCTQFSYSNRGGSGDITDGLKDVAKFLEVVEQGRPHAWAMENIPRVAKILRAEIARGGSLNKYAHLIKVIEVVDVSAYGVPQSRTRMIAGDFSLELLDSYKRLARRLTLGDVVKALRSNPVIDPIYGIEIPQEQLTGNEEEEPLDPEELRMNREAKRFHPVYNLMSFPDNLDRPARTVTATCTRVSRESIVIDAENGYRRLTVRERASLQSFPITFDFVAKAHTDCLKMTGNAIPPLMTYYIAHAMLGTDPEKVQTPPEAAYRHAKPSGSPPVPKPDKPRRRYPATRRFRAAIPHLRFGSGVRFELVNEFEEDTPDWRVAFLFGTSKAISTKSLDRSLWREIADTDILFDWIARSGAIAELEGLISGIAAAGLQSAWTRTGEGVGPYEVVDGLGRAAHALIRAATDGVVAFSDEWTSVNLQAGRQESKLRRQSVAILAGMVVGSWFNTRFDPGVPAGAALQIEGAA